MSAISYNSEKLQVHVVCGLSSEKWWVIIGSRQKKREPVSRQTSNHHDTIA